jgi:hypothetical protein
MLRMVRARETISIEWAEPWNSGREGSEAGEESMCCHVSQPSRYVLLHLVFKPPHRTYLRRFDSKQPQSFEVDLEITWDEEQVAQLKAVAEQCNLKVN